MAKTEVDIAHFMQRGRGSTVVPWLSHSGKSYQPRPQCHASGLHARVYLVGRGVYGCVVERNRVEIYFLRGRLHDSSVLTSTNNCGFSMRGNRI